MMLDGISRVPTPRNEPVLNYAPGGPERAALRQHRCGREEVEGAIDAALVAYREWSRLAWPQRAAVFLKAADLLAGPYRMLLNAATMLGQSKTPHPPTDFRYRSCSTKSEAGRPQRMMPCETPTFTNAATACSRCWGSCAALICTRMRACPTGTTGYEKPTT